MELPVITQKAPFKVRLEASTMYGWCTCGLSKDGPFCDSSHKGTDWKSIKFTAIKTGDFYLCGCKHTATPPFCDGSHKSL